MKSDIYIYICISKPQCLLEEIDRKLVVFDVLMIIIKTKYKDSLTK